tara:strand:- start:1542 stop:1784 length:243 start_codon:yes stop_codon:yes gene_type:complete
MVWIKLISIIFFSFTLESKELNSQELIYFNFLDTNNDNYVSYNEIEQITNLIFQLIDENKDDKISIDELNELNNIINLFE